MDWVLDKVVDQSDCGAFVGNTKITDLVFADDAVIFAESLEVLVMALEALQEEAKPLGLEVSWLKTKVSSQVWRCAPYTPQVLQDHCILSYAAQPPCQAWNSRTSTACMEPTSLIGASSHPKVLQQDGQDEATCRSSPLDGKGHSTFEWNSMKIAQACALHNFVKKRDGCNFEDTLTVEGLDDIHSSQGEYTYAVVDKLTMSQDANSIRHPVPRYGSQARNIIMSVYRYFSAQWGAETSTEVIKKTAKATEVPVNSVKNIKRQSSECGHELFCSPVHHAKRLRVRGKLDNFEKECIRKEILSFYERGELPTLDAVLERVQEDPVAFEGRRTTLWKAVKEMGFRYKKVTSGRAILVEREDIVVARTEYLRLVDKNRKCSPTTRRPEVFIGETWINQNECVGKCWTVGDGTVGPKLKTGKGSRFIVLHAGDLLKPANKSRDTSQDNFTMAVSKELRGRKVDISEPPPAVQRQASRRPATRSATETFLIGYPSSSISGSQLPTNRQAFQYFLHLQSLPENTGNPKHQDLANETVEAIIPFWQMARIKTMTKYNAAQHFMTLHKKHRDLARNKGRTGDPGGKRSAFVLELDSLFDIGASDAIQEIERNRLLSREKKDKDIRFYQDQKTERKAHMSGHDKNLSHGPSSKQRGLQDCSRERNKI
ncbi:hypothetical protein GWK47_014949 [Chionoecetes opilio]|uniref:Reverse transcriptase domain-containing protein n=1 Tax=Chionoecetes opilio TaxID=41210 RepID=A0A8J4XSD0_CHIOP|nr:hypothetical protein GWK47_014949 [Chionoecetes opilio]